MDWDAISGSYGILDFFVDLFKYIKTYRILSKIAANGYYSLKFIFWRFFGLSYCVWKRGKQWVYL